MGMSASQARLICLNERLNDLEYQGQQINQERTVLSQQCTDLYNSLLDMTVPVPPSTSDFTKTVYEGTDGTDKFRLGNITPNGSNHYNINFNYTKTGHAIVQQGKTTLKKNEATIKVAKYTPEAAVTTYNLKAENKVSVDSEIPTGTKVAHKLSETEFEQYKDDPNVTIYVTTSNQLKTNKTVGENDTYDSNKAYYILVDPEKREGGEGYSNVNVGDYMMPQDAQSEYKPSISSMELSNFYICSGTAPDITCRKAQKNDFEIGTNGELIFKTLGSNEYYAKRNSNGSDVANPDFNNGSGVNYTVEGNAVIESADAIKDYLGDEYETYAEAIKNAYPDKTIENFYMYVTTDDNGKAIPHFILADSISTIGENDDGTRRANFYDYVANGTYTATKEEKNCELEFDTEGRITQVGIPYQKKDGTVYWRYVKLSCTTETDNDAYEDAFNQYEYDKAVYDHKQKEINAKTSIIQQEDKNLELKLTRLDNERTQITTEIEAVKKVISDDIESSYKTFSG